ncbi:MAG TPA: DUF2059 domain-containing protein [Pseudolabrys sp.]|nr:DUF2059 domain-containing protein [Pseudolabrys sp.]
MNVAFRIKGAALFAAVVLACAAPAAAQQQPAPAQPQPSAAALASAKELAELKGADSFFKPVVFGVVEQTKNMFMQTNPNLQRDLNEVAAALSKELAPRYSEIMNELIRSYATQFTEQELKDLIAFYKSPLGKKALEVEPQILDHSMDFARNWSRTLSETVVTRMRAEMKKRGHDI